jgi:transcriptional regulator with XRE-family HTH domain
MQSYLSEVEAGKRNISIDNIGALAKSLGVPIARLFDE